MRLALCTTEEARILWVQEALTRGQILSDMGLWLAGVDAPARLIARVRKQTGLVIVQTRKWIRDAANEWHHDVAWRLEATPDQKDPRSPTP